MPIPTNTTAATATVVSTIPSTINQDVKDGSTVYDVWYKYTATQTTVLSVICFSGFTSADGSSAYRPITGVYMSDNSADTNPLYIEISAQNKPLQVQVLTGRTYWFEIHNWSIPITTTATFDISFEFAPDNPILAGAILINDDTGFSGFGFNNHLPGYFANPSTGAIYGMRTNIVAGETGDVLSGGKFILSDEESDVEQYVIYNSDLSIFLELNDSTLIPFIGDDLTSNHSTRWYISRSFSSPSEQPQIKAISLSGTVVDTWDLNVDIGTAERFLRCIAVNQNDTILYYGVLTADMSIRRYDLVNRINLSNLVTGLPSGIGSANALADVLVIGDGTLVATYVNNSTGDWNLTHYSTAGAILHQYNYTEAGFGDINMVRRSTATNTAVWVWLMPPAGEAFYVMGFKEIDVYTGTVLNSIETITYQTGTYDGSETGTPESKFGHPISCPFLQLTQNNIEVEPPNINTLYVIVPNKRNDVDEKIPNPTWKTALMP